MLALYVWIKNWFEAQEGQDLIEYALLAGLIALACVALLVAAGGDLRTIWTNVGASLIKATTAIGL